MFWSTTTLFMGIAIFLTLKTFWNIGKAYHQKKQTPNKKNLYMVELLRPMVFIKLFASAATIPFFSQYILKISLNSGHSPILAGWIYTFYQIAFLLALIPGGYIEDTRNPKRILLIATSIEALLFLLLSFSTNIWAILAIQILFGCCVPFSAASEYAYIFHFSSTKNRNAAISLYLNTIRGSMIAGITCGGLLATYIPVHWIFRISTILVCFSALYTACLFPKITVPTKTLQSIMSKCVNLMTMIRSIPFVIRDVNFLKILLCVGLPIGLLQEGIINFSLPIVLTKLNMSHATIGQLLVAFSIGFFMTNKAIAKKADILQKENRPLFFGLIGITLGILLLGYIALSTIIISLICLLLLGMFAGFLLTPAIAFVSKSAMSEKIGQNVAVATYRTSETIGSIVGPILIGHLLLWQNYSSKIYIVAGMIFLFCALLYVGIGSRLLRRRPLIF